MKKQTITTLVALIGAIWSVSSPAADKALNGGGGEIEFAAIKAEINQWLTDRKSDGTLEEKLALRNARLSVQEFTTLYADAISRVGNKVKFQDAPIKLAGYSKASPGRICGNDYEAAIIRCNNLNWEKSSPQIKYAIVMHEYLGVARVEKNRGEYSNYPISSQLVKFVKRSEKFELNANPVIAKNCPNLNYNGVWKNKYENKFDLIQLKCGMFVYDRQADAQYYIPLDGNTGALPSEFYKVRANQNENFASNIAYSVSINENKDPTAAVKLFGTYPEFEWLGGFNISFNVHFATNTHEVTSKTTLGFSFSNLVITPQDENSVVGKYLGKTLAFVGNLFQRAPRMHTLTKVGPLDEDYGDTEKMNAIIAKRLRDFAEGIERLK